MELKITEQLRAFFPLVYGKGNYPANLKYEKSEAKVAKILISQGIIWALNKDGRLMICMFS